MKAILITENLESKNTDVRSFIEKYENEIFKYINASLETFGKISIDEIKSRVLEKYFTAGHKFLDKVEIEFNDKKYLTHIYKTKTKEESKTRFLVWFPEYCFCAMVWMDCWSIGMNDVGKNEGKNWYSYCDYRISTMLDVINQDNDSEQIREFSEIIFKKHEELNK